MVRAHASILLACALALVSPVAATIPAPPPPCGFWQDGTSIAEEYQSDIPVEGYVLFPLYLVEPEHWQGPLPAVEVLDEAGTLVPGSVALAPAVLSPIPFPWPFALWTSDAPLAPGARYRMRAAGYNALCNMPIAAIEFEFVTATRTLEERMNDVLGAIGEPTLDWKRTEVTPHCCPARSDELCPSGGPCFACMASGAWLGVLVANQSAELSLYVQRRVTVSAEPNGPVVSNGTFDSVSKQVVRSPACQSQYCVTIEVASPFAETTVVSDELCLPGGEPVIEPAENGAEIFKGNPCVEGSSSAIVFNADPPECGQFPEVLWFASEVEGLTALGVPPPPDAGVPPQPDAGVPPQPDAGVPTYDAGAPMFDAGTAGPAGESEERIVTAAGPASCAFSAARLGATNSRFGLWLSLAALLAGRLARRRSLRSAKSAAR